MYLCLSNLGGIPTFEFPYQLPPIKSAIRTTKGVLECSQCPKESTSAMQNIMMLITLVTTITDSYRKMLVYIDNETARAEAAGEKKNYRIGDNSPEKWHMHTGTLDCPMGFNIDLDPDQWKSLARQVIKADVHGSANASSTSLMGLVGSLEERQVRWHENPPSLEVKMHSTRNCNGDLPQEHVGLKLIGTIRHHIERLRL